MYSETVITDDGVPECRLVVDQALLELASEARQVPAPGTERESLVKQLTRCVVEAHHRTSMYTRAEVEAGFHRYNQVTLPYLGFLTLPYGVGGVVSFHLISFHYRRQSGLGLGLG